MIRRVYSKLPKPLRKVISKAYYEYGVGSGFRNLVRNYRAYFQHKKNLKAIAELNQLINQAKEKGQPIFVQFPVLPWDLHLFQRPQQLTKAMSEVGALSIYVLPVSVNRCPIREISNNLYITDQFELLENLEGAIVSIYLNYPPSYLDRYLTPDFFNRNKVFYEYVDHIDEKIWGAHLAAIMHKRFDLIKLQNFKYIIGTSKVLYEELTEKYGHDKVAYLPNAVDVSHYDPINFSHRKIILPSKLEQAIQEKRKIIGYFGALAPWIWSELLIEVSEKRPDYLILLIGPDYGGSISLPETENILLTGAIDYQNLPLYASHFDVSIIPFRLGEIARTTSPLKLFEYFAIGKPIVVTSDLIECTKFEEVFHAETPEGFIQKIDEAINLEDKASLKAKYKDLAHENSWKMRTREMLKLVTN